MKNKKVMRLLAIVMAAAVAVSTPGIPSAGLLTVYAEGEQTAISGTAVIKTSADGDLSSMKIGDTIKATVTEGAAGATYVYKWYRVSTGEEATEEEIDDASEQTYTLTKDDYNCKIKVNITANGTSGTLTANTGEVKVAKKECETEDPTFGESAYNATAHTLTATVTDNTASKDYEYSLDAGKSWVNGAGNGSILKVTGTSAVLTLEADDAYAASAIQIRVAETDEVAPGNAVAYTQAITADLKGTVTISGTMKCGEIITANVTGQQSNAVLSYQFIRVTPAAEGVEASEANIGSASTTKTYTLAEDDIGKTIKVKVTATGYTEDKPLVSAETASVQKGDGRKITEAQVKADSITDPAEGTETYTYTMKKVEGAKYQMTEGADSKADETKWNDTNEFTGITPGKSYTFHAYMPETDAYAAGDPVSFTVAFPKLTHAALNLAYKIETVDNKKKVTITEVEGAEYTFDGTTWANANTYDEGTGEVTIGIRYPDSDIYENVTPITQKIDVTKETQEAPSAATVNFTVNKAGTKYVLDITGPTVDEGSTLEYSFDGNTYSAKDELNPTEYDADKTVNLYVRLAGDETHNASSAVLTPGKTPAASTAPTFAGETSFAESTTVTLNAASGAKIYYTTDGSEPTTGSKEYTGAITLESTTTIKAIAVETDKIFSEVVSQKFTKGDDEESEITIPTTTPDTTTTTKDDGTIVTTKKTTNADGSKTETVTETATDGTVKETVTETAADGTVTKTTETTTSADGSATKVENTKETNAAGNEVAVKTTTKTDSTGAITGITEKSTIASAAENTSATVTVKKDASGDITSATAAVSKTVASGNKVSLTGAVVHQLTAAAGTDDVKVTVTVKDAEGNTKFKVKADANELTAGNKLAIYQLNTKTGEYVMVNAKTYTVNANGSVSVSMTANKTYELVTQKEANAIAKQIKATVKVAKSSASVKSGKTTTVKMSSKLNKNNVKSITYTSSRKSVATVNKNGKVTTKKKGTVTVKAKVTLKNGATKTVSMKIKVK